jgi:hypothetical protein
MAERAAVEGYGLDDPEVLNDAACLAPELFAALAITKRAHAAFPIESTDELEAVLRSIANKDGAFASQGVRITSSDLHEKFPAEALPITDRHDLLVKAYMAILAAHHASARDQLTSLRSGQVDLTASHPMPNIEDLWWSDAQQ